MKFKSKNKTIALILAINYSAFASESFDYHWLKDIERLNKPNIKKTAPSNIPRSFVNMEQIKEEINKLSLNTNQKYIKSSHLTSLVNEYAKEMGIFEHQVKVKIIPYEELVYIKPKFLSQPNLALDKVSMNFGMSFLKNCNINDAELKSVIMHELAHIKNNDPAKGHLWEKESQNDYEKILGGFLVSFPIFFKLTKRFQPTRFKTVNAMIKIVPFIWAYGFSTNIALNIIMARKFKRCELQADSDSLRCHKDLESSIECLKKCENYAQVIHQKSEMPSRNSLLYRCVSYFIGTHPSLNDRISNLHKTMDEINLKVSKG